MKLLTKAVIGTLSLLMISCDILDEQRTDATFTLTNNSNTTVKLNFIFEGETTNNFQEVLATNESYEGLRIESSIGGLFDDPEKSVVGAFFADSISIIFDNERITTYTYTNMDTNTPIYSEPVNRNIFRSGNYEEVSEGDFIYTITQEDYNNAIPCNGPCE